MEKLVFRLLQKAGVAAVAAQDIELQLL